MAMKIKIDREYTAPYEYDRVRDDIKAFSDGASVNDIISHFLCEIGKNQTVWNYVTKHYVIRAFPGGWAVKNNMTTYVVEAILETWQTLFKVRFYIDQDWEVNTDPGMFKFITYGIISEG